ncbi:MAG: glycoside hydrolase family 32 protein, partial [Bryobacteraceae bacterium]
SRDLVDWEHLPIALAPSIDDGEDHVYSGGAILGPGDKPMLFYTSIGKREPEQWLAMPKDDDLLVWEKYAWNPILRMKQHRHTSVYEWRDPFLFRDGEHTYLVTGGNLNPRGGQASVQIYQASGPELTSWKHEGVLFRHLNKNPWNIECPNFFKLGEKWVLLISPHGPVEYFAGIFDPEQHHFFPETHGVLDPGKSYASNISFDAQGRCILWLWGRTETPAGRGWNNVMVMSRILTLGEDGHLRQNPAPEFEHLRTHEQNMPAVSLDNQAKALAASGDCLELHAEFEASTAKAVGLRVRVAKESRRATEIAFEPGNGMLTVGSHKTFVARDKKIRLRVFLDKRVLEVYVNDGEAAVFTIAEAGRNDTGIEAFARGGAASAKSLRSWTLKPAQFSLDNYVAR